MKDSKPSKRSAEELVEVFLRIFSCSRHLLHYKLSALTAAVFLNAVRS